jgi:heme-degrading monooxygenase HmoA
MRWLRERAPQVPGFIAEYVLEPDERPHETVVLVAFDSKENYVKNSNDPAQQAWAERFRRLLAADPEWTDGEIRVFEPATVPL